MTHEDFNKITDLRPYLLRHPNRAMIETSCLHFLGDDAQIWWAARKDKFETGPCFFGGRRLDPGLRPDRDKIAELEDVFSKYFEQTAVWKCAPLSPEQLELARKAAETCRWLTFKEVEAMRNGTYEQQFGEGITGTTDTIEDLKDL